MASTARFTARDLVDVVVPGAPVRWGDRIVYAAQRTDGAAKKSFSALFAVPRAGGAVRRLTQGDHKDRMPRAADGGAFLAFVSDRGGTGEQIHRLDAGGGDARVLTAFPAGSLLEVAIAPDGSRLAVLFAPAAPEDDALPLAADLVRTQEADDVPDALPGAASAATRATDAPDRRKPPRARVTVRLRNREDGRGWLGGRAHVWIVDAESGDARRLTRGGLDFSFPTWTPSGDAVVACVSQRPDDVFDCDGTRNDLVRIDVATGEVRPIAKPEGGALVPTVSPDGRHVAYVLWQPGDDYGHENPVVWVSPLAGGEPHALTAALDRPALDVVIDDLCGGVLRPDRPIWSDDGREICIVVSDRGSVRIWDQPVDGGPGRYRTDDAHAVACTAAVGGGDVAAVVCSRGTFPEIAIVDREGKIRVVAAPSAALVERCAPRAPERVELERDGVKIAAYYYAPRGVDAGARAPAVLYIHGGPCVAYGERLFFEMQWLADLGYAVLCTNPRGSQSYGHAYASAIKGKWGEPDRGDQLAFVDWLAARPEVDPDRVGVAGGSYGGYMTLLLCATTDRFRAAIAERGLYNWATLIGSSDYGHCQSRLFGGKWPWEDPQRYIEASPIRLVSRVKTPMLVIHQEGDLRVGPEQALQLFAALKLQGTPTAVVLFPDEDHGMTRGGRIDRRLENLRQIEAWLAAWLGRAREE